MNDLRLSLQLNFFLADSHAMREKFLFRLSLLKLLETDFVDLLRDDEALVVEP